MPGMCLCTGVTPLQLVLVQCMRLPHRWLVGRDCCGARGLAWPAEWWEEWLLWLAEGTLELIGGLVDALGVAVGAAMPVRIACSNLLLLHLIYVGAKGLL